MHILYIYIYIYISARGCLTVKPTKKQMNTALKTKKTQNEHTLATNGCLAEQPIKKPRTNKKRTDADCIKMTTNQQNHDITTNGGLAANQSKKKHVHRIKNEKIKNEKTDSNDPSEQLKKPYT